MVWLLYALSVFNLALLVDYFVTRRLIPRERPICPMLIILSGAVTGFWSRYSETAGNETFGRIAVLFFAFVTVVVLLHGIVQLLRSRKNNPSASDSPDVSE